MAPTVQPHAPKVRVVDFDQVWQHERDAEMKIDSSMTQDERAKYKLVDRASLKDIECTEILEADEDTGECEVRVHVLDERGHPKLDEQGNRVMETIKLTRAPQSIRIVPRWW